MSKLLPKHGVNTIPDFANVVNKKYLAYYFKQVSGAGSLTYNPSATYEDGSGRFEVTGIGRWEAYVEMPVSSERGLGAMMWHSSLTGTATVAIGAACYDASHVLLGNRPFLFTGTAPTISTMLQKIIVKAGAANDTYVANTRFVKFYIDVTANTGTYIVDRPVIEYASRAQMAIYL